jgi:hypothetical protein
MFTETSETCGGNQGLSRLGYRSIKTLTEDETSRALLEKDPQLSR